MADDMTDNPQPTEQKAVELKPCVIDINRRPFDVAEHYRKAHKRDLPPTPTMTVCEIAFFGGLADAKPTYRKDGSIVTDNPDYCVVECDEAGQWEEPVWLISKDATRAIPLRHGMCFAAFPDGSF